HGDDPGHGRHAALDCGRARGVWLGTQPLCQALPDDQFHAEVRQAVVLTDVVDGNDVRVVEGGHGFRLGAEPLDFTRGAQAGIADHLEADDTVGTELARLVHTTHAAATKHAEDFVTRQDWHLRGCGWQWRLIQRVLEPRRGQFRESVAVVGWLRSFASP